MPSGVERKESSVAGPVACPPTSPTRTHQHKASHVQVFDFERWKTHRSSSRYLRHVLGMGDSKIVSRAWLLSHLACVCPQVLMLCMLQISPRLAALAATGARPGQAPGLCDDSGHRRGPLPHAGRGELPPASTLFPRSNLLVRLPSFDTPGAVCRRLAT